MVFFQGIKATILRHRDKQPYTEYATALSTADALYKRKRFYVEAGTGERFVVMVEVTPEFDFKSSSHVQLTTYLHDGAESNWPIAAKDVSSSTSAAAVEARQIVWDTDERLIDGKWMSCGLAFSELRKAATPPNAKISSEAKAQGRVSIRVTRGTRVDCTPYVHPVHGRFKENPTSSNNVLEKKLVSHATRHVKLAECEPPLNSFKFQTAKGAAGAPIHLFFRFRSKKSLEQLGVKPRPPILRGRPAALPSNPSSPVASKPAEPVKKQHNASQAQPDDEEELSRIVTKRETTPPPRRSLIKRACTVAGRSLPDADTMSDRTPSVVTEPTAATQVSTQPRISHRDRNLGTAATKSDDDEVEIVDVRPVSRAPISKVEAQPELAVPTVQTETVDVQPVSRAPMSEAEVQPKITAASKQIEDQAQRERKRAILKKRLEVLRAEQELLELDD